MISIKRLAGICVFVAFLVSPAAAADIQSIVTGLQSSDAATREKAAADLESLPTANADDVDAIILNVASFDDSVLPGVVIALSKFGTAAVPGLQAALASDQPKVRRTAAQALSRIGAPAKEATADLAALLVQDDDEAVRGAAAEALRAIGPEAKSAAAQLAAALKDDSQWVRCVSVEALANLGDPASPYLDMIASIAANDPDPYVRDQAAMSVAQLQAPSINALAPDADASPVDDSLRSVLEIRSHIAQGSGTGDAAEMLGKAYLSAVPSPDTAMLENIVPGDADVGDLFAHRTDKKSAAVIRGQAIEGLRDLGSDAVGGLPYLIIATSDPTPWVRAVSAETIGNLGSEAGDAAVPYLVKMLEDQDSYVQQTALQALRKLAPP